MTIGRNERETVRALCLGYERRARAAALLYERTDISLFCVLAFLAYNERIDKALKTIDEPLRVGVFQEIIGGKGYNTSPLRVDLTRYAYYAIKARAIESIARALKLIL